MASAAPTAYYLPPKLPDSRQAAAPTRPPSLSVQHHQQRRLPAPGAKRSRKPGWSGHGGSGSSGGGGKGGRGRGGRGGGGGGGDGDHPSQPGPLEWLATASKQLAGASLPPLAAVVGVLAVHTGAPDSPESVKDNRSPGFKSPRSPNGSPMRERGPGKAHAAHPASAAASAAMAAAAGAGGSAHMMQQSPVLAELMYAWAAADHNKRC